LSGASPARLGLDALLRIYPLRDVRSVDSQRAPSEPWSSGMDGPWLLVSFADGGDRYAIWKATGAAYRIGSDGTIDDDPVLTP
jgi:hypothetical protein